MVLAAGASVITIVAQRQMRAVGALELLPLSERIENALVAYATYLVKAIWPAGLAVFYPHPRHTLPLWQPLGAALMLVAVSLAVIRLARRHPYLAVGWLWYLGTLVPVIGVVQVGRQAMADRYTYVPLIGIFIMVAWGVPELLAGWRWRRVALRTAAAASLAALTACTWLQLRHWKNSVTLFERALAVTVNNAVAHGNLGQALAQDGRLGDAIVEYEAAVRIAPDDATTQRNLGAALDQQGKTAEAAPHLSAALRLDPRDARAHDDLGIVLTRLGRYDEATQEYSTALRLAPDSAKAHNNFADLLLRQGKFADAVEHCTAALRLKPDYAEAHNTLGVALARQGKVADAAAHFSAAVRLRSDYPEARRNLALALEEQRQR